MVRSRVIQSFVARIWVEQGANGNPTWRGHIQHIQGEEAVYFRNLAEVSQFIEQISGIPWPQEPATANDADGQDGTTQEPDGSGPDPHARGRRRKH